jgi:Fic family protein
MGALERFLHARDDVLPLLARAAPAHVQFETIHPFLDGNGRVGRLLVTLLLCHAGVLREPLLYLSLYLKRYRATYYSALDGVLDSGDWEAWLGFFLEGVRVTAQEAVSAALRVYDAMKARPLVSVPRLCKSTGLSFPAVSSALSLLVELGILRELTGKRRDRVFVYDSYLAILGEGTEAP